MYVQYINSISCGCEYRVSLRQRSLGAEVPGGLADCAVNLLPKASSIDGHKTYSKRSRTLTRELLDYFTYASQTGQVGRVGVFPDEG